MAQDFVLKATFLNDEYLEMANEVAAPGWYYAEGDPAGTTRFWDGSQWTTEPQWNAVTIPPPPSGPNPMPTDAGFGHAGNFYGSFEPPVERGIWESYKYVLREKYADFDGRARRKEYWGFGLVYAVIAMVLLIPGVILINVENDKLVVLGYIPISLLVLFVLAHIAPSIAIVVRRLHDTDKSGGWYFISFVPYIGGFILLILLLVDGTRGPNQYGPDTKLRQ